MWWWAAAWAAPSADVASLHALGVTDAAIVDAMHTWPTAAFRPSTPDCLMRHGVDPSIVAAAAARARPAVYGFPDVRSRPVELGLAASAVLGASHAVAGERGRVGGFAAVHLAPIVGLEVEGSWSPSFGDGGWTSDLVVFPPATAPFPPTTRAQAQGVVRAAFTPLTGDVRVAGAACAFGVDLAAGFGAIATADDLAALSAVGDPAAEATAHQIHPGLSWSVGPRVALGGRWSLRARVDGMHWNEAIESVSVPSKRIGLGLGLATRL